MTALPSPPPRLLTVDEFAALGEDTQARYELQEGHIVMSPRPAPDHQHCLSDLQVQLRGQLPADLEALPEVDVDLELVGPGQPGFARAPDLVVVPRAARGRIRNEGGLMRARDVTLVVEIVSPGSRRMDTVVKHGEYADAGIPHYWIIELDGPVSLTACHLAGEFGYVDAAPTRRTFRTKNPFPVRLNLDALV